MATYKPDSKRQWCNASEAEEHDLGRLFQDLQILIEKGRMHAGENYILRAGIKTRGVETKDEITGGATVGISYVDEAGWTPSKRAYQCEIGHVKGTTGWREYESRFTLREKPRECVTLYLYFDFNSAKGNACFSGLSLVKA